MQPASGALGSPPAPKHPIAFIFHWAFKVRRRTPLSHACATPPPPTPPAAR